MQINDASGMTMMPEDAGGATATAKDESNGGCHHARKDAMTIWTMTADEKSAKAAEDVEPEGLIEMTMRIRYSEDQE